MGPTAVGKTSLALQLAGHFSTQIISADSRQCYKEMDIGVAKPTVEQLQSIHHYFINSHSVLDKVNAVVFEKYALEKVEEIFTNHNTAIMVGGTGLYIQTFCNGIDPVPAILPGIREEIVAGYETNGLEWLQEEVKKNDPLYFSSGETQNPRRLMRAMEVKLSTGKSIIQFQSHIKTIRDFSIVKIGIELPRAELYHQINNRVDTMVTSGLPEEVSNLRAYQHLSALQTVGYKEFFDHFNGKICFETAVESVKINTRHYAKRQMTWFKKDKEIKWCAPDFNSIIHQLG